MYDRIINLFTQEKLDILKTKHVLIVGVGGVGSGAAECLVRSGVRNLSIIDFDNYEESNLNRQLHATRNVIGKAKVDVVKSHLLMIDNTLNINAYNMRLDKESKFDFSNIDYIIDACDSVDAKIYLIKKAKELNIKLISSLGVGNRLDSSKISINTLNKTINDPLGKKLRHELKKDNYYDDVVVVSSCELPKKLNPVSSYIGVSLSAGILLADYIIKDVLNEKN